MFLLPLATADPTPLMDTTRNHMFCGFLFFGIAEGLLIAWLFKTSRLRAVLFMIPANFISAVYGPFILKTSPVIHFADWFLGDAPLYHITGLLIILAIILYAFSILLEWPFVIAAMRKTRHGVARTLLASFIARTATYLVLCFFYIPVISISLMTKPTMTAAPDLIKNPTASIYFVDYRDQHLYQLPLDGSPRRLVIPDPLDDVGHMLELVPSADGDSLDLCLLTGGPPLVLLPKVAPLSSVPFFAKPTDSSFLSTMDWRPADARQWDVRESIWASPGILADNSTTNQHFHLGLETPFLEWRSKCATVLPHDQVIYEVGHQIVLLDLSTKRLALLALGSNPVVVLNTPATVPTQPLSGK